MRLVPASLAASALLVVVPSMTHLSPAVAQLPANSRVLAPRAPSATTQPPTVLFIGGDLTIRANNSSLTTVLHQISTVTGMKISGSLPDGPVFGTYGPGDPQRILAALLDGTGTNILILSTRADKPLELVLTPRTGSVTPPNPNASANEAANDEPPMNRPGPSFGQPQQSVPQQSVPQQFEPQNRRAPFQGQPATDPAATQPTSSTQQVVFPPIGAEATPSTATTTPTDTSTATDANNQQRTPQQIFEQLQKLQQQRTGGTPEQ